MRGVCCPAPLEPLGSPEIPPPVPGMLQVLPAGRWHWGSARLLGRCSTALKGEET